MAGLAGWAAACSYLEEVGWEELRKHDQELVAATLKMLAQFNQVTVVGPLDSKDRVGSVAFVYQDVHAHDVGQVLDSEGVAVRSGHHCTMPLHTTFGWPATTRASFQIYNTLEDVEALASALHKVAKVFGK